MNDARLVAAKALYRIIRPNATWGGDCINGVMSITEAQYDMQRRVLEFVDAIIEATMCPNCAKIKSS